MNIETYYKFTQNTERAFQLSYIYLIQNKHEHQHISTYTNDMIIIFLPLKTYISKSRSVFTGHVTSE